MRTLIGGSQPESRLRQVCAPSPTRRHHALLAADQRGSYGDGPRHLNQTLEPDRHPHRPADMAGLAPLDRQVQVLAEAVQGLGASGVDAHALPELEKHLDGLREPIARLQAYRSLILAEIASRRAAAAGRPDDPTALDREERDLARQQRMEPHDAKRASHAGRAARRHERIGSAYRDGSLNDRQAALIGETLRRVAPERQFAVEAELLELAQRQHGPVFARAVRRIQAREAPRDAERLAKFRHAKRSFRMWDNDVGGLDFAGTVTGVAAETLRETVRAFTRPDAAGEQRSAEQRAADGLEVACQAALRSGDAPTSHGVRPQVLIVATVDELRRADGFARFGGSGEMASWTEVGSLIGDCQIALLLQNAAGVPLHATEGKRSVPTGLWRALVVRDGGCVWDRCDAPPSWCDVAHGEDAFRHDGRLQPSNAALLCRRHHRLFDSGWFDIVIEGATVSFIRRATRRQVPSAWQAMVEPHRDTSADRPAAAIARAAEAEPSTTPVMTPGNASLPGFEAQAPTMADRQIAVAPDAGGGDGAARHTWVSSDQRGAPPPGPEVGPAGGAPPGPEVGPVGIPRLERDVDPAGGAPPGPAADPGSGAPPSGG